MTSIGAVLCEAASQLATLPQASPHLEAELLLCDATGLDRVKLLTWPETEVDGRNLALFRTLVQRRLAGEPIAYIRGHQAFWTLDLRVTPHTLIPRPETELLVEVALERLSSNQPLLVLDAGSGCGAIATALASERPSWALIATDSSLEAAQITRENLHRCAPTDTIVVNCDWLAPIGERTLDAILGNPPYIPDTDPHLWLGDPAWEPRGALAAGPDGLNAIRNLTAQAASRLRPGGFIGLEHGHDQGPAVRMILKEHGFGDILTYPDLSGHERVTTGVLPE